MKVHKRPKTSRIRGARTCGWGFRQKHKGHGNKGGFGMAGSGSHKRQIAKRLDKNGVYFGRKGYTSRSTVRKKTNQINLADIFSNMFVKDGQKIELKKYKILGVGEGFKAEIVAKAATATAIEKMSKAGGKIILPEVKKEVKKVSKKEEIESEE